MLTPNASAAIAKTPIPVANLVTTTTTLARVLSAEEGRTSLTLRTTTTTQYSDYDCEAVPDPSPENCKRASCLDGRPCVYYVATFASSQVKKCVCAESQDATTTTQPSVTRCEAVQNPNEKTCMDAICPDNKVCKLIYVQAQGVAAMQVPACACVDDTTTTTLPSIVRCEAVQDASPEKCKRASCPNNLPCTFYPTGYDTAGNQVGKCKCEAATTTTLSQVRCEAVKDPNEKTCMEALCPPDQKCKYVVTHDEDGNAVRACMCVGATTTTQPPVNCRSIENPNANTCSQGSCPPGMRCMLRPGGVSAGYLAAQNVHTTCECIQATTTTTLYPPCSDISPPSARMCVKGDCPPNYVCRFMPGGATTGYLAANMPGPSCKCVPCDCPEETTTTLPRKCEETSPANANTCTMGVCPPGTRCVFMPGGASPGYLAAQVAGGSCECVEGTTTTIPDSKRCEAMQAGYETCAEGICPPEYDCKYVQSPAAANLAYCKCVMKSTTTTTLSGQVRCEAITDAGAMQCMDGICPPNHKCSYVMYASAAIGKCECVLETTTTMPSGRKCTDLKNPNEKMCMEGVCPPDYECGYVVDTAGVGYCKCVEPQDTTTTTMFPTVPSNECRSIEDPSPDKCSIGSCPDDFECVFTSQSATGADARCMCQRKPEIQKVVQRSFFGRVWDSLFS
ncbi:MAG: hypothetical protein ABIH11_09000 [Candidatus Altiarchaeota archaeon]